MEKICVTGGAGFIGTNFVRYIYNMYDIEITVIDKLTYAGTRENLDGLDIKFIHEDVCDLTEEYFDNYDYLYHFAAESHVDRSIASPHDFLKTNILGTVNLLELCKKVGVGRFIYISTDEVYGSVGVPSREGDVLSPSSAYSASKASAETFCNAYLKTFRIPIIITRSSNNYGPYQHREKFIPVVIVNALKNETIPVYGTGRNIRDWVFVLDNCEAIDFVARHGGIGEVYNIGANNQVANIDLAIEILGILGKPQSLISFVEDRLGHDYEYNLDCFKVRKLGWSPKHSFRKALRLTCEWYEQGFNNNTKLQ
jgi:dTDP-glucose 4,6-dehydratase